MAIEIKNLKFGYDNLIFNGFDFYLDKGSFMTVIGDSCCGKTTLFNILCHNYNYDGTIKFFNKSFEFAMEKGYIGFVSLSFSYLKGDVGDIFIDCLKNKGRSLDKISLEINRVCRKFKIEKLIFNNYDDLSDNEKILVMFVYQFLNKPRLLIIDDVLSELGFEKKLIVTELKRFNKRGTVLNISNDAEDVLFGTSVFIMGDDYYNLDDLDSEVFLKNNLRVPFIFEISFKLKAYDLIKDNYLDMRELIDFLWD